MAVACKAVEIHEVIEKLPQVLMFDKTVSNLDRRAAEHLAATINRLRGRVTILFITHQVPQGLEVDEIVNLGLLAAPTNRTEKEGEI